MKELAELISKIETHNVEIFGIKTSKSENHPYKAYRIHLAPEAEKKYLENIVESLVKKDTKQFNRYHEIVSCIERSSMQIATVPIVYELLKNKIEKLEEAIAMVDVETDIEKIELDAVLIIIEDLKIKVILRQNPITKERTKKPIAFLKKDANEFVLAKSKIAFNLFGKIDILYDDTDIYFFSDKYIQFFNLERKFKKICEQCMKELGKEDIIEDFIGFERFATTGRNPQKFINYDEGNINKLKNEEFKKKLNRKFGIGVNDKGKIKLTNDKDKEIFLKILCNKIMDCLLDETPYNVSGAHKIE